MKSAKKKIDKIARNTQIKYLYIAEIEYDVFEKELSQKYILIYLFIY